MPEERRQQLPVQYPAGTEQLLADFSDYACVTKVISIKSEEAKSPAGLGSEGRSPVLLRLTGLKT